jgi:hypothetical protein
MIDEDLVFALRVSIARIAQAAGLDLYIPGAQDRVGLPFEELFKCAHEERGWNTLCALILNYIEREHKH